MQNHKAKREKAKRRSKLNSHTFCVLSMLPTHLHRMRKAGTIDWVPVNLVPRAHVPFGQHQDTELWNNQFPETKILGLPASRRMRGLV